MMALARRATTRGQRRPRPLSVWVTRDGWTRDGWWRACRAALLTLVVVVGLLRVNNAWAEVTAELSVAAQKVEVGQPLRVELDVSSDEGAPESPRLTIPGGFGLRGPSVSTRFSTSIKGWSATTRREIGATWEVTASRVGKFTIGPAQAFVEGKAITSNPVTVEVVPTGTLPNPSAAPQRRPRSLFDDDDFFQGFPGLGRPGKSMLDDLLQQQREMYPEAPPEYHQSEAKDPVAFLAATINPGRAVVGQQVTLRIIAYGAAGRFREADSREPRRADFYSVPLWDNSQPQPVYNVRIGQTDYLAVKIREYALFPLKAGKLEIGPMKMAFYGSNYVSRATGQPVERESQTLVVNVEEPPTAGRPLGYQLGDVGRFRLTATVSPRTVSEGDSLSVVAVLEGEGRLPESLRVPEQTGLEWLQPTLSEQQQINARQRVSGKRTFTYIVKATRAGTFDLGELKLPYYDPNPRKYAEAMADLGQLVVQPPSTPTASPSGPTGKTPSDDDPPTAEVVLSELARPRPELRPFSPGTTWFQSPWLWPVLVGMPLVILVGQFGFERLHGLQQRRRTRRSSLSGRALQELRTAETQRRNGEEDAAVGSLERAIFLGLENATDVKARAVLRDRLSETLAGAGLESHSAQEAVQLLEALELWRFTRDGQLESLFSRAKKLLSHLPSRARTGKSPEASP